MTFRLLKRISPTAAFAVIFFAATSGFSAKVYDLRADNIPSPSVSATEFPRLSWKIERGEKSGASEQTAWRIQTFLGKKMLWDSGKTEGKQNFDIKYGGTNLPAYSEIDWRVKIWDNAGGESEWSAPAKIFTGPFEKSHWGGKWIGARVDTSSVATDLRGSNWIWLNGAKKKDGTERIAFRKTFAVDKSKTIESAFAAFACGGNGYIHINGTRCVSAEQRRGGWKTGLVEEATSEIFKGPNVVTVDVTAADGAPLGAAAKIEINFTDGTKQKIVTDASWKAEGNPENYWSFRAQNFDDSKWKNPDTSLEFVNQPFAREVSLIKKSYRKDASAPMLRREFNLERTPSSAKIYICGLGLFDLRVNGEPPDDSLLNPAGTQYDKRVFYKIFDVSKLLKKGVNAISVELGNFFFNETAMPWGWQKAPWRDAPKMIFELVLKYPDGTETRIVSDERWKSFDGGPRTFNSIYYGEIYDARKEPDGWTRAGFDDSKWLPARMAAPPSGKLVAENMYPIKKLKKFDCSVAKLADGTYVVSLKEMTSGWARIALRAPRDTLVTISYGEKLNKNGKISRLKYTEKFSRELQQDSYICNGSPTEFYEPKFSYKGYQYIQIDGYRGNLDKNDVECWLIADSSPETSKFSSDDANLETLHALAVRTFRNNMHGKPTDCPVWEKAGWTGDASLGMETFAYNFDIAAFMLKYIGDIRDTQTKNGVITLIAPSADWGYNHDPVWNSAYPVGLCEMSKFFGTFSAVEEHYANLKLLAESYLPTLKDGVSGNDDFGDWDAPFGPDLPAEGSAICSTAYLKRTFETVANIAGKLGNEGDTARFGELSKKTLDSFNAKFFVSDKKIYDTHFWNPSYAKSPEGVRTKYRQTSNILPLAMGIVPQEFRADVFKNLLEDIKLKNFHLDTGIVGTKFILTLLTENGESETAMKILRQKTYPSWGWWLANGATSGWEGWSTYVRSRNHYMLCTYDEWIFKNFLGIKLSGIGGEQIEISPNPCGVARASGEIVCARGKIESGWNTLADGSREWKVKIPFGSAAEIKIPAKSDVFLDGEKLKKNSEGRVEKKLGCGSYTFVEKLPE